MPGLRFRRCWQVASAALLLFVFLAALAPAPELPDPGLPQLDKWMHGMTFALLAIWFAGQYARGAYWRVAVGLLAFGALIEVCQRVLPWRSGAWEDLWANVAGIVFGLLIALAGAGGWSQSFERRFDRQRE